MAPENVQPIAAPETSPVSEPATAAAPVSDATKRRQKRAARKQVPSGNAYIQATYNNTIITFTDKNGNALTQCSAGQVGFKGPKKSTPYAAGIIVKNAVEKVKPWGLKEVNVLVKGVGSGREAAIRALNANGMQISGIKDITPIPHNGPRARKPRRV